MAEGVARPPLVTAAAVLLFVAGALNAISGFFLLSIGVTLGYLFGLISLAVAAAAIYAGAQVLALREKGRVVGMAVAALGILIDIYVIASEGNAFAIVGLLLYGFVLFALATNREVFS